MPRMSPVDLLVWAADVPNKEFALGGVVCIVSGTEQALFFDVFFEQLQRRTFSARASVGDIRLQELKAQLTVSFLGQQLFYLYTGFDTLTPLQKRDFVSFLQNYRGPHWIIFCINDADIIKGLKNEPFYIVDMSVSLDRATVRRLWPIVTGFLVVDWSEMFINTLFASRTNWSINHMLIILRYVSLLGQKTVPFFAEQGKYILDFDHSLYELAGHLLAGRREMFFALWNDMRLIYPEQFWISFFSEQIFKAYWFLFYMQMGHYAAAQAVGARLPFLFLKKEYKLAKIETLRDAHHYLYGLDWGMKNGCSVLFEIVFLRLFS